MSRCIIVKPLVCVYLCVCVNLTGEAVSQESRGGQRRVSMQQIKNDLVPLHGAVTKGWIWQKRTRPHQACCHAYRKTKQNQLACPPAVPSDAQTHAQSRFSMRHLPRSVINAQSEPAAISPYRFYIEHNEAAITQRLASAIKSFSSGSIFA